METPETPSQATAEPAAPRKLTRAEAGRKGAERRWNLERANKDLAEQLHALKEANPFAGTPPPPVAPVPDPPGTGVPATEPAAGPAVAQEPAASHADPFAPAPPPAAPVPADGPPVPPADDEHPGWRPLGEKMARKALRIAGWGWDRIAPIGSHLVLLRYHPKTRQDLLDGATKLTVLDEDELELLDEHVAPEFAGLRAPPAALAWGAVGIILASKALALVHLVRTEKLLAWPKRALAVAKETVVEVKAKLEVVGDKPAATDAKKAA